MKLEGLKIGRLVCVALGWLLLLAAAASAQIAFDASSNSGADQTSGGTISWSHTCTGSNLILVVGVVTDRSGAQGASVSSVTYNGVSLTGTSQNNNTGTAHIRVYLGYLVGPSTGSNTISVTTTGATHVKAFAVSLTGVNQGLPLDTNATGTTASATFTTATDQEWCVDVIGSTDPASLSPTSPQVSKWSQTGSLVDGGGSIIGPISPAGSVTTGWSSGANSAYQVYTFRSAASGNPRRGDFFLPGLASLPVDIRRREV